MTDSDRDIAVTDKWTKQYVGATPVQKIVLIQNEFRGEECPYKSLPYIKQGCYFCKAFNYCHK